MVETAKTIKRKEQQYTYHIHHDHVLIDFHAIILEMLNYSHKQALKKNHVKIFVCLERNERKIKQY